MTIDDVETVTLELILVDNGGGEGHQADKDLLDTIKMNVQDKLVKEAPIRGPHTTNEEKSEESENQNEGLENIWLS